MARAGKKNADRDSPPTACRVQAAVPWFKGSATGRLLWFCGSCHLEITRSHVFCPWCGRKLEGEKTEDRDKEV